MEVVPDGARDVQRVESLEGALAILRRRHGHRVIDVGHGEGDGSARWATGLERFDSLLPGGLPRGRVTVLSAQRDVATGVVSLLNGFVARATGEEWVGYVDVAQTLDVAAGIADYGGELTRMLAIRPRSGSITDTFAICRALMHERAVRWFAINLRRVRVPSVKAWESAMQGMVQAAFASRAVVCIVADEPIPKAVGHASSFTVGCARLGYVEVHGDICGVRMGMVATKNKLSAPERRAMVRIQYPRPHYPWAGSYDDMQDEWLRDREGNWRPPDGWA